ncbi:hypothetical protein K1719_047256 [Acacia pycnantha]|nr:hypothetical protein K1719_047256 [Acacia pycnantha]
MPLFFQKINMEVQFEKCKRGAIMWVLSNFEDFQENWNIFQVKSVCLYVRFVCAIIVRNNYILGTEEAGGSEGFDGNG